MKFVDKDTIETDRELSILDRFALDFITVLQMHTSYVIVSGYVSILLGRARASEDIDVIIPQIDFPSLKKLIQNLKEKGFYCVEEKKDRDIFTCLTDGSAVRFAKKDTIIPNIEMKMSTNPIFELALKNAITVKLPQGALHISNLELQIAYKEIKLQSPKDREDARHLKKVAEGYLDTKLLQHYKEMLRDEP